MGQVRSLTSGGEAEAPWKTPVPEEDHLMGSHRAAGRTLRLEGRSGRREKGPGGFGTTCGLPEQSRSGAVLGMAYTWDQLEPEGWGCVRGWRGQSPEGRHAHWEELGVAQHPGASARGWGCFPSVSLPPWWADPSSPLLAGGAGRGLVLPPALETIRSAPARLAPRSQWSGPSIILGRPGLVPLLPTPLLVIPWPPLDQEQMCL